MSTTVLVLVLFLSPSMLLSEIKLWPVCLAPRSTGPGPVEEGVSRVESSRSCHRARCAPGPGSAWTSGVGTGVCACEREGERFGLPGRLLGRLWLWLPILNMCLMMGLLDGGVFRTVAKRLADVACRSERYAE